MTKKRIDRLSVIHRREILWLKWYFLRDKENPSQTVLEKKIKDSLFKKDGQASFFVNLKLSTTRMIDKSDERLIKAIKKVYVFEEMNVIGACQFILFRSQTSSYSLINKWFDDYFMETYKCIKVD